jgi:hypothetical protein
LASKSPLMEAMRELSQIRKVPHVEEQGNNLQTDKKGDRQKMQREVEGKDVGELGLGGLGMEEIIGIYEESKTLNSGGLFSWLICRYFR